MESKETRETKRKYRTWDLFCFIDLFFFSEHLVIVLRHHLSFVDVFFVLFISSNFDFLFSRFKSFSFSCRWHIFVRTTSFGACSSSRAHETCLQFCFVWLPFFTFATVNHVLEAVENCFYHQAASMPQAISPATISSSNHIAQESSITSPTSTSPTLAVPAISNPVQTLPLKSRYGFWALPDESTREMSYAPNALRYHTLDMLMSPLRKPDVWGEFFSFLAQSFQLHFPPRVVDIEGNRSFWSSHL